MTFPDPTEFRLVVAGLSAAGEPDFLEVDPPATIDIPGVAKGAFYWAVDGGHSKENIGSPPDSVRLAGPGGSTFGVNSFPARSAGKTLDISDIDPSMEVGQGGDPAMHSSDTIDYEVVISGKVDVELPGGKIRTLRPGDLLVMGGVTHAWRNPYDEDCVYIVVTVGFNP
ncbi:cupin domain-containing protein [Microbacterium sp. cx-55]|uniref:cupin domain-containing protein n=1 Tax=unclassified Microbacterium TaxID=2609290 RepID=UPI001CC0F304|nr:MULTISPECIES: cupin domain-containing protein [unclassified Microbacterium]MBZ4486765.1 cupin domain-containing protein [Microbacterium sp. cx-55]MCC4907742.1 cupin domain-containing protein [Microbacterium sp. cx-59]UGB36279.1 cupin domain-containing protein [Microbacterium sp. cx-55]